MLKRLLERCPLKCLNFCPLAVINAESINDDERLINELRVLTVGKFFPACRIHCGRETGLLRNLLINPLGRPVTQWMDGWTSVVFSKLWQIEIIIIIISRLDVLTQEFRANDWDN